ncbi:MAG TPA: hypothetical protein VNZ86_00345, partial [Bacteroidia bacterium]|nr:hypothetical protein [Bacteroidia bacterium]
MKRWITFWLLFITQVMAAQTDTLFVNASKFIAVKSVVLNEFGKHDTLAKFYRIENSKPKYLLRHYLYSYSTDCNNEFKDHGSIRVQHDSILFFTDYWQKTGIDPLPDKSKQIYRVRPDGKLIKIYDKQRDKTTGKWTENNQKTGIENAHLTGSTLVEGNIVVFLRPDSILFTNYSKEPGAYESDGDFGFGISVAM